MFGNGPPPTSHRFPDLPLTPTRIIRSHGLEDGKCCAAGAGRRAHGSRAPGIGISFLPIGMTSFPDSEPAPFRTFQSSVSHRASSHENMRTLPPAWLRQRIIFTRRQQGALPISRLSAFNSSHAPTNCSPIEARESDRHQRFVQRVRATSNYANAGAARNPRPRRARARTRALPRARRGNLDPLKTDVARPEPVGYGRLRRSPPLASEAATQARLQWQTIVQPLRYFAIPKSPSERNMAMPA